MQNKYMVLPIAAPPSYCERPREGSIMNLKHIHRSLPPLSRNRQPKRPRIIQGRVPPPTPTVKDL